MTEFKNHIKLCPPRQNLVLPFNFFWIFSLETNLNKNILIGLRVKISVLTASKNPNRIHFVLAILSGWDFWTKLQSFFTSVSLQNNVNCSLAQQRTVGRPHFANAVSSLLFWSPASGSGFWRALRLPISLCVVLLCTTISLSHDSPL